MGTKESIIAAVGSDRWSEAAAAARRFAPLTGYGRAVEQPLGAEIPHEIEELIWDSEGPWSPKIRLLFEIYDEFPSYGHMMYAVHHYAEFSTDDRDLFWSQVLERLDSPDDAIAQPIAYAIWCDWFEDPERVTEAWDQLTGEGAPARGLERVLIASGPVPFGLKERLYYCLISNSAWHYYIFRSLLHSAFDVFGQLDRSRAQRWLDRLQLPADTDQLLELRARLTSGAA